VSDDPRTLEQLRAEIVALRQQIQTRTAVNESATKSPVRVVARRLPGPINRRAVLALWVAPLVLVEPAMRATKRWVKRTARGMSL
jgi:hypothetical protein